MTSSPGVLASKSMSSSDSPSEKYSWSFFSLRSRKGRTAIDFSGAPPCSDALDCPFGANCCAAEVGRFDRTNVSITQYPTPIAARTAINQSRDVVRPGAAWPDAGGRGGTAVSGTAEGCGGNLPDEEPDSGDRRCKMRSMKAGDVAPDGRRVH